MTMLLGFVKFGAEGNINDSYEKEYLYFSPLRSFRSCKKDQFGRYDPREGNHRIKQGKKFTVIIDGVEVPFHEIFDNFHVQYQEYQDPIPFNICSLYNLDSDKLGVSFDVDERMFCESPKALIIYNCHKFFQTLDKSLEEMEVAFSRRSVEYYEHNHFDGDLTLFHKDAFFKYQKEYRILLSTSGAESLKVPLPGLKDISIVVDSVQIPRLKFRQE
ncbi:hypothetical protein [Algoriphagus vanfongensis]|uniref:hypothetical protein n=1 Tax=Algoriphagus vanfongensis TaxID=426371 RepID=UPI00047D2EE9|nr:hypothetical protein [Algoriphagus vanfongensis]